MNKSQTAKILAKVSAYERWTTITDADVLAWQTSLHDVDYNLAFDAVSVWFGRDTSGKPIRPGHVRAVVTELRKQQSEQVNSDLVAGREVDPSLAAAQQRIEIDNCSLCDDHGFINGTQTCTCNPGGPWCAQPYDATFHCDHTDATLPPGFVPDVVRQVPAGS